MNNLYSGIYKALLATSVILFIIGILTSGTTSYGSLISGYSSLILCIMMILLIITNKLMSSSQDKGIFSTIVSIFIGAGPFLLMLAVIGFILYMMIMFKSNILSGHVSGGYYSFSNIVLLLLLTQLYIVYSIVRSNNFNLGGNISKVTSSVLYLLGVITSICAVIVFTILKYYTTDGFISK